MVAVLCMHRSRRVWLLAHGRYVRARPCCPLRTATTVLGRRLRSRVPWQHSALSALSWRSTCVLPPTLSSYADRTFAAAGPRLWNSLPVHLRNPDITYGLFRRQLKGQLFREAWTLWLLICGAVEKHLLTYLLRSSCQLRRLSSSLLLFSNEFCSLFLTWMGLRSGLWSTCISNLISFYSTCAKVVEYCDEHVCLSVWWRCDTLCTSGFTDYVIIICT